jgi:hypothetical protein
MIRNAISTFLLLLSFVFSSIIVLGQNSYKFIEPNISFSYDSTKLKISNRYSNTFYETESYDFKSIVDANNKIIINVKADHSVEKPISKLTLQKKMTERIPEILKLNDGRISILEYDKTVRQVGDFLCFGFILFDEKTKITRTAITYNHITTADLTEIGLLSQNRKSLSSDYKILENFIQGFTAYSKEKIFKEDSLIKGKYTVNILPTKKTI